MKITLKQIAQEAGVSQATVSRLVNQKTGVSPELEAKVVKAAKKMGVNLTQKKNNFKDSQTKNKVIGVMVTDLDNPYFQVLIRGAVTEAKLLNYGVQIFETHEDFRSEEETFKLIDRFCLDGLILCASRLSENRIISFYNSNNLPLVIINRHVNDPNICCIMLDDERSTFQAAVHLLDLGHKRIAYLAGPTNSEPSMKRRQGIHKAMEEHGLTLQNELCVGCFPNIEGGFQATVSLLSLPVDKRPTAIIAYNDLLAVGALKAARLKGIRVPNDLSIIGFDNIEITEHTTPPITTISPPKVQIAGMAMRTIYRMIMGNYEPVDGYIEIDAPLTLRGSTAPVSNNGHSVSIEKIERGI